MDPIEIIKRHYSPDSKSFHLLVYHSRMVAEKALAVARSAPHLKADLRFIEEAAMLHDIGILATNEPKLGCYGDKPYICHGYTGREILEREGLPGHALVCERHVAVGISLKDIRERNLPLPERDMMPISVEEQIICFADKFFSKSPEYLIKEKPLEVVRAGIARYGEEKLRRFDEWVQMFGELQV